jgi:septum site-determining protein MinD
VTAPGRPPATVVTVYSWSGGTGRTLTVASLGLLLAARGLRVGMLDTDLAAPALHTHFGLAPGDHPLSLADYLFGDTEIEAAAYEVTGAVMPSPGPPGGALLLVPSWVDGADELGHALSRHVDLGLLTDGIDRFAREAALDVVLLDTQNGLNRSAVVALLAADLQLLLVTGSTAELEGMVLIEPLLAGAERVVPVLAAPGRGATAVGAVAGVQVTAALPYATELQRGVHSGQFVQAHPSHPLTARLGELADRIEHRVAAQV